MEFLPNETHRVELKLPYWGKTMACVDGRTNTWRIDPDKIKIDEVRIDIEETITYLVRRRIRRRGYLPGWMPHRRINAPAVYALDIYPGSTMAGSNIPPPAEPFPRFLGSVTWDH